MNKYLEKIAEDLKKKDSYSGIGAEAAAGGAAASMAPSRVLGYHTVYHGTSKPNAAEIKKHGFDPRKGGTGAAGHSHMEDYIEASQGKVHVTKFKPVANFFAGFTQHATERPTINPANKHSDKINRMVAGHKNMFTGRIGETVKARVSDMAWRKDFEPDPDMGLNKSTAATTEKKIGTKSINRTRSSFANKEHLSKYLSDKAGKVRALKGVGLGIAGAGMLAHAVKRIKDKGNE